MNDHQLSSRPPDGCTVNSHSGTQAAAKIKRTSTAHFTHSSPSEFIPAPLLEKQTQRSCSYGELFLECGGLAATENHDLLHCNNRLVQVLTSRLYSRPEGP